MAAIIKRRRQLLDADLTAIAALATTSFGRSLLTLADASAARTSLNIVTGSYTPTLTNVSNVDASTASLNRYARISDTVIVFGTVQIDATAASSLSLGMSLPIASAFSTAFQAGGVVANANDTGFGRILADDTNDRLSFAITPTTTANATYNFIAGYLIV